MRDLRGSLPAKVGAMVLATVLAVGAALCYVATAAVWNGYGTAPTYYEDILCRETMNDAMMETVITMGGAIPAPYLFNKNLLGQSYYRQGDYKEALAQMTAIFDVMCSQGDTTSADYALITANLGICTMDMFLNEYPPIEQASPAQKDTIISPHFMNPPVCGVCRKS